ncbi:MAG: sensor histidine kinase [Deltaproteobacteria bacterium]|nr:sensor histidine kinase [Nannocystaceae bacterium]
MPMHEALAARRDLVVERWKTQVRGTLAPNAMASFELVDHIPEFVDEIIATLRSDAGAPPDHTASDDASTAAGHGTQRLRLGFSLDSVVREYGVLRDVIVAAVREDSQPTFRELQVLFDCIVSGIAVAVSSYTQQRDAELVRQANEHFAFIAHELRNPLSTATLAFQLLEQRGELPQNSSAVGSLRRGLLRTTELVDQTLQTARVASGVELRREWTTLHALFEEVQLAAQPEANLHGVELRLTIGSTARISVDVRLLRSAVGNLLRNGVKYTAHPSVVELRGTITDGRVVIEVEDHCGGLPPGKVEAAFAPFVRLDDKQSGFGLGLAIAKQAADAHGGSIRVQNLPGKGCIFVLDLPVAVDEA